MESSAYKKYYDKATVQSKSRKRYRTYLKEPNSTIPRQTTWRHKKAATSHGKPTHFKYGDIFKHQCMFLFYDVFFFTFMGYNYTTL